LKRAIISDRQRRGKLTPEQRVRLDAEPVR
jgi:hypothetical protein